MCFIVLIDIFVVLLMKNTYGIEIGGFDYLKKHSSHSISIIGVQDQTFSWWDKSGKLPTSAKNLNFVVL